MVLARAGDYWILGFLADSAGDVLGRLTMFRQRLQGDAEGLRDDWKG